MAAHGLLAFTVNLQGGSPEGYSKSQPWENSAIDPDGDLRPAYMKRLAASWTAPMNWGWSQSWGTSISGRTSE